MKLSHTDLLPLLTIMAGGVLGASLSIGLLGRSPAPELGVAPSATAEALRWNAEWRMAVERANERARERMEAGQPRPPEVQFRAEALVREQHYIEASMIRLAEARGGPNSDAGRRLFNRKEAMVEEIDALDVAIARLNQALLDEWEASGLAEAASMIEEDKLRERVRYSRGLIGLEDSEYMREFEAETTRLLEELQEELIGVVRPDQIAIVSGIAELLRDDDTSN